MKALCKALNKLSISLLIQMVVLICMEMMVYILILIYLVVMLEIENKYILLWDIILKYF